MKPYLALARAQAKAVLTYRLNFVLGLFSLLFQLFAMLAIWTVLLSSGRSVAGFDLPRMKAYLLIGFMSSVLVSQSADWRMAGRIQDGMVSLDLVKPVDYQRARFAEVLGGAWSEVLTGVSVAAGVILLTGAVPWPAPASAALFVASMLVVLPLRFLIVYLSAMVAFYTQNYLGVVWARTAIVSLLSGALVPLAFLPQWLQAIAAILPFASLASAPGLIYLGQVHGLAAIRLLGLQIAWTVVLWFSARLLFAHAVRKVTIHGG